MVKITLCINCLNRADRSVIIGDSKGRMDQYYVKVTGDSIDLCSICVNALEQGDFGTLAARFTEERTIKARINEVT